MKWYSVKQFMPPISTYCIIFTENNDIYIARLENKEDPSEWIHEIDCEECESLSYTKIYGVTHFCVIEPVPVF